MFWFPLCVNFHVRCYSIGYLVCALLSLLRCCLLFLVAWMMIILSIFDGVFCLCLSLSIYLSLPVFLDINDGNKGAQWRKEKKKTHAQNDRWRKTHLTPYVRIFIAHCAIINVILLISNHLLLPCHINRYRLFIRSNTFKSIYFVVLLLSHHLSHHYTRWDLFGSGEHSF